VNISTILSARIKKYWRILGPGLITGASDDDPSGIATYSQAGAGFGFATLWTAIITFPLMADCTRDVRANRDGYSRGTDWNT
jgi:Mn2+/Fe2+ NRAMP family transporter